MIDTATIMRVCPDCGAEPGELHDPGCDVERCQRCGHQAICCPCIYEVNGINAATLEQTHPKVYTDGPTEEMLEKFESAWGEKRLVWTGEWPGVSECREFGLWCRMVSGYPGWHPCQKDDPGAREDLNRLNEVARWDAELQKYVLR